MMSVSKLMTARQKFYLGVAPVILLLGIFAFVPNLDQVIPNEVFVWGLPVLSVAAALVASIEVFRGRARLVIFAIVSVIGMASLLLVGLFPSITVVGFASGAPALTLLVAVWIQLKGARGRHPGV